MKKVTAIVWLLVCLIPAWGKAEEPVVTSTRGWLSQSTSEDEEQPWRDPLMSEVKVRDDELGKIVGHGLETPFPWGAVFSGKLETAASRIKLWDESDRGAVNTGNSAGQGIFQRITLSTMGNK
ncbi:hypothetical protein [Geotalea uraniireducens]|nr:hypothetical protein [Geotalea uraniireducens]